MSNQGKRPDEVEFNTIVGKNIRYLRKSKKLTQGKLAAAIGVATQQVSKYELGTNGLHSYSLYKVAHRVFNISMDVLADPQMIIKYEGFKDKHESQEYQTLGTATPQDAGYLQPQICVGSLEEIKDKLKKDGIDPEETILPALRELKKKNHGIN
jgi:transcriptional regulator with XRE-family HTH domain